MILNLTQHNATPDQIAAGVVDPHGVCADLLRDLLTFSRLPTADEIVARSERIADIALLIGIKERASDYPTPVRAMIGGAPYLMPALEQALIARGFDPVYSFSTRETEEHVQPDGSVKKVSVFKHAGFVPCVTT